MSDGPAYKKIHDTLIALADQHGDERFRAAAEALKEYGLVRGPGKQKDDPAKYAIIILKIRTLVHDQGYPVTAACRKVAKEFNINEKTIFRRWYAKGGKDPVEPDQDRGTSPWVNLDEE